MHKNKNNKKNPAMPGQEVSKKVKEIFNQEA
jgi:hypothetical protein